MSYTEPLLNLSVSEKVYKLRKHHGISQDELAEVLEVGPKKITAIERGEGEYTEAQLKAIKILFKIEGLPLTERERDACKWRLYYWRTQVRAGKMDKAKEIQKEFANIDNLAPCDMDIVILCRLFEVIFLIVNGDSVAAEKKLSQTKKQLNGISLESLYHYYCCNGYINAHGRYEDALRWYLNAYELKEDNEGLLPEEDKSLVTNIATCYTYLDLPAVAVFYLQKAQLLYAAEEATTNHVYVDAQLAVNLIELNQLSNARRLLAKSMRKAEGLKDNALTGYILFAYGFMNKKAGGWESAIDYFNSALGYAPKGTDNYYLSIYHKIYCMIQSKKIVEAMHELERATSICRTNDVWAIYFEALGHYLAINTRMSVSNNESSEYIENIAIPHFIKHFDYFISLDYYKLLEDHHQKLKRYKKVASIKEASKSILEYILANKG